MKCFLFVVVKPVSDGSVAIKIQLQPKSPVEGMMMAVLVV